MFGWLKNISNKVTDLNSSVNEYKEETNNQTLPVVAYINKAKKYIEQGKFLEAKDVLNNALLISDKDALVYKYIGICEEGLGNFNGALEMYNKSASINPQDKNIWHKLGLVQINLKQFEIAQQSFETANKVAPLNTDILTAWGMSFFKQRKYPQALEKFTEALKINRYNFSAILLSAIVEIRMKKYEAAQAKLDFLVKAKPNESCMYEYANLYFLKGNYKDAIAYAKKSLNYNKNMLPAYLILGKIYSIQFDLENSIKYFYEALNNGLESTLLYAQWGDALIRLYKFNEAVDMFNKVLAGENEEECDEIKAALALCYAEINDFDKAQGYLNEIETKIPNNVYVLQAKGLMEYHNDNYNEALSCFKKVLETDSTYIYSYYHLAKIYQKLNNNDMVKDSYDKLTKFNENFVSGYLEYAKFLISINDFKDAQRKLRKVQNSIINNQEILNLLFYTSYILVKENVCEYNVKEALTIADKIEDFKYPELKGELEEILKNIKK